mgnify:CR=1 FL=1
MTAIIPQSLDSEIGIRVNKIAESLRSMNVDAILLGSFANVYYASGRVFSGYTYITSDGNVTYFVKRPVALEGDNVKYIRKPEQMSVMIDKMPATIALELGTASYNTIERLKKVFDSANVVDGTSIMSKIRSVKTEYEISKLKTSGIHHETAYGNIKKIYREGMTDIELQIEIERLLRNEGCLGLFRVAGDSMEIYMGSVICGYNADIPSPYDFAMGGGGLDESIPGGCNGSLIRPGNTVMIDMCGNFTGYMTDMTRVFHVGNIENPLVLKAHQLSIDIHHRLVEIAKPGAEAKMLYETAVQMVKDAGLEDYFMGHKQKAGFIGHGVGIEINELPVIAPRSNDVLAEGNVIALEPKFVIPGVGAVGIENTYVVRQGGLECITNFPEEIRELY